MTQDAVKSGSFQRRRGHGWHAEALDERRQHDTGDAFIDDFLNRLPGELADSFTREQLNAVRMVYGARRPTAHQVEVRRLVNLGPRSFYFVFLMGRASPGQRRRLALARNPVRQAATRALLLVAGVLAGYLAWLHGFSLPL